MYAGFASLNPFIVVYYQGLGFNGAQIGLLTGLIPLITFFGAPFWTWLADTTRRHRLIMSLTLGFAILELILFPFLRIFPPVFLLAMAYAFCISPTPSFGDNATMFMLGENKDIYGRIRLGGTIGFSFAAIFASLLIKNSGLRFAFWIAAAMLFLALLVSQQFVHAPANEKPPAGSGIRILLANPRWILFLTMAFAGGLALTATGNYLFPLLKELGADASVMGIAMLVGTVLEYPALFFGNRLIRRFKPYGLFLLTMILTATRLVLFGLVNTPTLALLVQLLNGLTFPAMWMAGVAYANEHAPEGMGATAQGLFGAAVFGIGSAAGGFLAGPLLESLGGRGLFLLFGIVVFAIMAVTTLIEKRLPAERPTTLGAAARAAR
jgi:PPP family 3-phenylpropionic acid transporter